MRRRKNYRLTSVRGAVSIYYRRLAFYVGREKKLVAEVPVSNILRALCHFRLLVRLFRLEPRCVEMIDENLMIFCLMHKVWILNIETAAIQVIFEARPGFSDPLNFCKVGGHVYWGDYGNNDKRDAVRIYRVDSSLNVETVYGFPQGTIRHIHNIIYSDSSDCFWILTGDNDKDAGIYKSDRWFEQVEPVRIGEQNYRAVVAFPYKKGIIYATDSVEKENHIFVCTADNNYQIVAITGINGSCIYGTEIKDWYIFSSTVEPPEGRGLRNLFSDRLGGGIKSRDVHVVAVKKNGLSDIRIIAKYKKDRWPMKLFQYGAVMFPAGLNDMERLLLCPIACEGHDGDTIEIQFDTKYDKSWDDKY